MYLFKMTQNKVAANPATLLIKEFKDIYERDRSKDKSIALKELSYIYYTADYNTAYLSYPQEERQETIINDLFEESWEPDPLIQKACDKYKKLQETISLRFLQAQLDTLEKIIGYYKEIDFKLKDKKGNFLYKEKDISASMGNSAKLIDSLEKLKDRVKREESEKGRIKGDNLLGLYEDPDE